VGVVGEDSSNVCAYATSFAMARWKRGLLSASLIKIARNFASDNVAMEVRRPAVEVVEASSSESAMDGELGG